MVIAKVNDHCHRILRLLTFDIPRKALIIKAPKSKPMTTSAFRSVLTYALLVGALVLGASCNKEKPTTVVISVKDADGRPVPEAYVRLYANPAVPLADASRLKMEAMTSGGGKAEFDYSGFFEQGQAGFAVLDILTYKDTMYAEGIIKVLEEETNEETLIMEVIPQ
jgi:hypothetical protein